MSTCKVELHTETTARQRVKALRKKENRTTGCAALFTPVCNLCQIQSSTSVQRRRNKHTMRCLGHRIVELRPQTTSIMCEVVSRVMRSRSIRRRPKHAHRNAKLNEKSRAPYRDDRASQLVQNLRPQCTRCTEHLLNSVQRPHNKYTIRRVGNHTVELRTQTT